MRQRPILFSAPMVRAILDGKKSQTRRIVKPEPRLAPVPAAGAEMVVGKQRIGMFNRDTIDAGWPALLTKHLPCPYGVAGDRLWVRETFAVESNYNVDSVENYPPTFLDGRPVRWLLEEDKWWQQCHYRATEPTHDLVFDDGGEDDKGKWTPSIHMPRWASRITLEVTGVRVERLHDISEQDARAEGVTEPASGDYRTAFVALWESINGEKIPWASNPFVWVISFKRIEQDS